MAWIEMHPAYTTLLRESELASASALLDQAGILVNRHRHRRVEWLSLPDGSRFYLKKESAVTWRQRLRNAWHGFGWSATLVREAKLLHLLKEARIGCPEVVACGEDRSRAFLLLRDEHDMTELRVLLPTLSDEEQSHLAEELGRELARMHDAGFSHPDLFAKHVLVKQDGAAFRFCLLDWQRGRQHRFVSWRLRCRDLSVLDATLHASLGSDRLRLRCLRTYQRAVASPPPLGRLARQIRRAARLLTHKRHMREIGQRPVTAEDQQFVQLLQGRLLVVRSHFPSGEVRDEWRVGLEGATDRAWELPPLAHVLFRLHRFGVPAPRLVAVSRQRVHVTLHDTMPLEDALDQAPMDVRSDLLRQSGVILRQVHAAGYRLPAGASWWRRLGVVQGTTQVMLAIVEPLEDGVALSLNQPWSASLLESRERQAA